MQQIGEIAKKHAYRNKKGDKQGLNINAIPNNMEKYMAFMLGNHLTFIDSFQFMSSSLDKLVSNLPKDDLIYTSKVFKGKRLNLMSQKGVYPYDFMDSFEKFNQMELPTKDQLYSVLNDQHITDDEYDHDLYLGGDVLLLADVFESFRRTCLQYYKLDPCHYFTSPGLSWDAMLKMTNIKLELMTDIDMIQFIEKGMRGGVSYIANRYGKANNKYMKEYDEKAPSKYIMYLDANNLYGWAMSQYLPTGNFKWMSDRVLNDQHITDDEYDHAMKVWKTFKIKTMREYHDLYLGGDVLLLADVFESFRKTFLQYYKLDPCHYFTSPGLSWDAMLKMTNIKLELMTDIDMFQFIEKGMCGGVSYIANRYGKANNKYMKEYDEKAPSKYIMYLDANNLYGWAMSQYLPTGNFKWMSDREIKQIDLGKYKADGKKGLIFEVDLEYPQELHDMHNDYPMCPEKVKVTNDMLSGYCKNIAKEYNISIGLVSKLIPTLRDKKEYVLHYCNL